MAVESTTVKTVVVGSGSTGQVVPIPFAFNANAEIRAVLTDTNGLDSDLTIGTQYTLTGAGNPSGGELTTLIAVGAGQKLTVVLEPEITQLRSYNPNDNFPAKSHEGALDKLTRICQRLAERIGRTFQISESGTIATLTNRIFGTDAQGKFKQFSFTEARTALNASTVGHTHAVSEVTGLQAALDGKSATVHQHAKVLFSPILDNASNAVPVEILPPDYREFNVGTDYTIQYQMPAADYTLGTIYLAATSDAEGAISWGQIKHKPSAFANNLYGPFANDAAAASSSNVAIGSLYYTADGSVKRRMS
jgi:hypothetical protein